MENFSEAVQTALQEAFIKAQAKHNTEVTENHLLSSFLEDSKGYFHTLLEELQINPDKLMRQVDMSIAKLPTYADGSGEPQPARNFQSRVLDAQAFAKELGDSYVSSDHFLLSFWKGGGDPFSELRKQSGIDLKKLKKKSFRLEAIGR